MSIHKKGEKWVGLEKTINPQRRRKGITYTREKISKEEAIKKGVYVYWKGEPCRHGHLTYRYTNNDCCVQCGRDRSTKRAYGEKPQNKNPEQIIDSIELERLEDDDKYLDEYYKLD